MTGWVKINVDGSVSRNSSSATIGGMLRGPSGGWLVGFRMRTGMSGIFSIEAKIVLEGLKLAWNRDFRQVELECDIVLLVDVLRNGLAAISSIAEIRLIHEWCSKDCQIKFRHISRDSNKVADQLAKMDEDKINCLVTLEDPPLSVRDLLEKDIYNSSMDES
ncbi:hypothetical protein PVK06_036705 [Gossypium arboreum]|uniref:RNase H type-1 domain-containing protein n=1 Tax=Gossypium arboreum TaxID=29729 RepID=A0ABR0NMH5_GOSAR|nr:hypothetical protein PVK06_036705 [Gossypium arboreum]